MKSNPRRDAPKDDQFELEIVDTQGRDRPQFPPAKPIPLTQPSSPPPPPQKEATPLIPSSTTKKDVPEEEDGKKGKKKRGKQKLDLVHKKTVKITCLDWLLYIGHLAVLYGWLILMIYLLLKATKSDRYATQCIYFALFLLTVAVIAVVVLFGDRERRKNKAILDQKLKDEAAAYER